MTTSAIAPVIAAIIDKFSRSSADTRRQLRIVGTSALVVGGLVSGGLFIIKMMSRAAIRKQHKHVEAKHDKALNQSFPASDPPASQYFDIPVNRQ